MNLTRQDMSYTSQNDWKSCTRCGECLMKCPVLKMDQKEAQSEIDRLINGEKNLRVIQRMNMIIKIW